LPKELDESAFVDGARTMTVYTRIILPNAIPAMMTVGMFSLVWQYNDTFFAVLFFVTAPLMSIRVGDAYRLNTYLQNQDPLWSDLRMCAGVVMCILPLILIYIFIQRYFIESFERSGIV